MVKSLTPIESKYFLKKRIVSAITAFVVAFLFLFNFAFATEMKISDQEVDKIKTALGIVDTASSIGSVLLDGGNIMTVLKTTIKGGQAATDVTYGLLVLSAINEMELMDLVLSLDYQDIKRAYFEQILDERTSLVSYWKGVGFDIPKVISGRITSPMSAMALNTFEMTDKAILIFAEFEVLKKGKLYDGLWRYFDERRNGESHQGAWDLAEPQMGFVAKSTNFWGTGKNREDNNIQLEIQFAALYEKWGPYATPQGISKEYKEQLASELRNTLVAAIEERTEDGPLYVKEASVWEKFTAQLVNIKNTLANLVSQVKNPFSAGPVVELSAEIGEVEPLQAEKVAEDGPPPVLETQTDIESAEPIGIIEATTSESTIVEIEPSIEISSTTMEATTTEPV
ncbi:MAG: hypothetical protein Q7R84_02520, partial [bacterium]|nr:hypothetical protein [bacterium]